MTDQAEKRACVRYECAVPIESKRGTPFEKSQTVDISQAGAGLIVQDFVQVDTQMAVEIALAPQADPIIAIGQVKWVQQIEGEGAYRVGLCFQDIEKSSQSRLKRFFR